MKDFCYDIIEHFTVLKKGPNGWTKELNAVSWNNGAVVYDIREWSPDHERMSKGVTFTRDEFEKLHSALKSRLKKGSLPKAGEERLREVDWDVVHVTIFDSLCVLSKNKIGWRKEVTITSWNNDEPKVDIRYWEPGYGHMYKGIRLTEEEAAKLAALDM